MAAQPPRGLIVLHDNGRRGQSAGRRGTELGGGGGDSAPTKGNGAEQPYTHGSKAECIHKDTRYEPIVAKGVSSDPEGLPKLNGI